MSNWPKISSYFSQDWVESEKNSLFKNTHKYSGHRLMVPANNDYINLPHCYGRQVLFNHDSEFNLVSNICPHRQAMLLEGSGNTKNISCKLHCWTFTNKGDLKAAPYFNEKVSSKLETKNLNEWNGLLFEDSTPTCNLKKAGLENLVNFNDYIFDSIESEIYNFNWKSFVEIYLENYHVFSMHPGLRYFVDPKDLEWQFGEDYSIQKVGIGKNLKNAGTEIYKEWQEAVLQEAPEEGLRYGAIWMYIYPNIMIEWYPNILVVSTIYPNGSRECTNHVEFYYPKELYAKNPEYFKKQKQAYMETALEDNEACLLLERGRKALYDNDQELYGPIDSFLEAGVSHFYKWYSEKITKVVPNQGH